MNERQAEHRALAVRVVQSATEQERLALREWAIRLLELRATQSPAIEKARQAIALTKNSHVIWPTVKLLGREVKRLGWTDRGIAARLGLGGAAVGVALFGGHGAGIAALGTAIGVPLWVVIGSGAAFAGVIIEEVGRQNALRETSYIVIDAEKER